MTIKDRPDAHPWACLLKLTWVPYYKNDPTGYHAVGSFLPKWRKGRRGGLSSLWITKSLQVRVLPSAP